MAATRTATIATGILDLWMHSADETADAHDRLTTAHGDRFLVGIGVSHSALIDSAEPGRYGKPLAAMSAFLDGLDSAATPLAPLRRVLAALGPKMLELAQRRAAEARPTPASRTGPATCLPPMRCIPGARRCPCWAYRRPPPR
jgi:hypothetical protein